MPTYQYACTECEHSFEQFQAFSDDALTVCPQCQGRLRKVFNAVGVVFKGSGFYRTDSRSAEVSAKADSKGDGTAAKSSESGSGSSSGDSSGGDSPKKGTEKPAAKSESTTTKTTTDSSSAA